MAERTSLMPSLVWYHCWSSHRPYPEVISASDTAKNGYTDSSINYNDDRWQSLFRPTKELIYIMNNEESDPSSHLQVDTMRQSMW